MANTMIVKPTSCTFASAAKAGAKAFRVFLDTDTREDASDGAVYTKRSAVVQTRCRAEVDFEYMDTLTGFTAGAYGSLVIVGKEGKGGSAATYTAAYSTVKSISYNSEGGGTVSFVCESTDGTTAPIIVS